MRFFIRSVILVSLTLISFTNAKAQWWDTTSVGTTWYHNQHNGSTGRMIVVGDDGYIHMVWTNGLQVSNTDRHIYYNYVDPAGTLGWPYGYAVESSVRAGYTTLDVMDSGIACPAFHQQTGFSQNHHTAVAADFFPHAAAFLTTEPDWLYEGGYDLEIIWPKMQIDRQGRFHIIATENVNVAGAPRRQYYTYGIYDPLMYTINFPPAPDTWIEIGHTQTLAADVATSDITNRVAFGWTRCREEGYPSGTEPYTNLNNDIYILIDDDGLDPHFNDAFNLTQFLPPDPQWLPDSLMANRDTLRAFRDMSLFFDQDDYLHVAFTTIHYYALQQQSHVNASLIWHWTEQFPGEFKLIANEFNLYDSVYCGENNVKVQRPSLGQNAETGYLYCAYQVFDTDSNALSFFGLPSGEIYVSVSTDCGYNWAVGTNITRSITPPGGLPGECKNEIHPSMAKVVDNNCHILYILDRDAGWDPGIDPTIKSVIYHCPQIDVIPTMPLIPQDVPFHTGYPGITEHDDMTSPVDYIISQVFPNPFNPKTKITFQLPVASDVRVDVFDIRGRNVGAHGRAPLHSVGFGESDLQWYSHGAHQITFDGSGLSSGIYIYRLTAGDFIGIGKMVLMK